MELPFTLEILGNSHFRLRHEGEDLQRVFPSVKDALDYVKKVSDEGEIVFQRKWEDDHHLLGGLENHRLIAGMIAFTSTAKTPDYEFVE